MTSSKSLEKDEKHFPGFSMSQGLPGRSDDTNHDLQGEDEVNGQRIVQKSQQSTGSSDHSHCEALQLREALKFESFASLKDHIQNKELPLEFQVRLITRMLVLVDGATTFKLTRLFACRIVLVSFMR